jgi:hypothetical protein
MRGVLPPPVPLATLPRPELRRQVQELLQPPVRPPACAAAHHARRLRCLLDGLLQVLNTYTRHYCFSLFLRRPAASITS